MPIQGWYNSTNVTTDELNTLLPGIKTKYGSGTPVYIHFDVMEISNVTVTESNQVLGGKIWLNLGFYPVVNGVPELAVDMTM